MWMQQRISLKLSQKPVLTQSLRQLVKLLALNKLELKEEINQELTENPILEISGEAEADQEADQSLEELSWAEDHASQALGMRIVDVGPGRAVLEMTVREDMVNGHAIGHGGLTFALADSAFAFACNSHNRSTVAAGAEIRFLAPTRLGDVLVADAVERWREGRDGVCDVTVRCGETVVAEFVGRSKEIRGTLFDEEE